MRFWLIALLLIPMPARSETPGAALFLRGEGAEVAINATIDMPATRFSCAGCHGADGAGRAEGGTVFPPIRWSALDVAGYDEQAFIRALTEGITPDDRTLSRSMPRFKADRQLLAALADHLRTLDALGGITATEIGVRPSGDAALDAGFIAAIARVNEDGGAFGRKLVVTEEENAGLDLVAFARNQWAKMETACLAAAIAAIRDDGHRTLSISGVANDDVVYRVRAAGLKIDPAAQAVLHIGTEDHVAPMRRSHFGCIDQLGPLAASLVQDGGHVTLVVPDRQALVWAVSSRRSGQEMRGYVLGSMIGRAALTAGRDLTLATLTEAAQNLTISTELVRLSR
ncbi:hypothetical protein JHW45_06205 [Paracoccus stylophorae]|uniref:Cytochrome c domain-containing protein n=1 Tax=Paracoccus stylophorae TaxID=659350 RepID=A0ABY7T1C4_9RHOB|nr:hypothetical protein [Paracoccus stylophorae]WCR11947.1 hypothetical protein JHW45_06205 [Paracoccus stylophorae]